MSSSGRRGAGWLAVVGLLVLGVVSPTAAGAADPPEPDSQLIGCDQASVRLALTESAHLDPSCTYTAGFDITASDVTLDCQGALISRTSGGGRGIEITTPAEVSMSGVTVRNCRVEGFLNSVRATRVGFRDLAQGEEFDNTLDDIVIEDSEFFDSTGVGVYVDGYTSGVTLRNLHIHGAGSSGIYLEAGSKENTVVDNDIIDNGFRENGPEGELFTISGLQFRFWGPGREGLSVDGSFDNVITGNRFEGNSAGGIFIYTNCGEYPERNPGRWYERRYGADRNLIEGNTFRSGVNGVWVGARMAENTFPMECSQEAYSTGPFYSVVLDRAADNTIRGNTFDDVTYGVRVEDDRTVVEDNVFTADDDTHHAVVLGTPVRTEVLGLPVSATTVRGNVASIAGNRHPYRWVHGEVGTTYEDNASLGQQVGICEGRPLPYNPFVMVLKVALEPVGSPPTPTPDLTVPTVGALPSCDPATPPRIVPGAAEVIEGDDGTTTVEVPVTLSEATVNTVTAQWVTLPAGKGDRATIGDGSDDDVVTASGTVTFLPGQTQATVAVEVRGDLVDEPTEMFAVSLRNPTNGAIGGYYGLGVIYIVDDDGVPRVLPGGGSGAESDGFVSVPVTLSNPSSEEVTVEWTTLDVVGAPPGQASVGSDYTEASGVVTFAPGEVAASVEVPVVSDGVAEDDEYVVVSFRNPTGATMGGFWGLGLATITASG